MESQPSNLNRPSSSLLRSPTLRSSVQNLSFLDPEETKPHSPPPPPAASATTSGHLRHRLLLLLSFPLTILLILSFFHQSPSLLNLTLFSSSIAAFSLILKKTRLFLSPRRNSVRWFIGDEEKSKLDAKGVKEGVEFYSNGDFYEGEFHNAKCSGSGVYSFFNQGRYEGDWIDGKYDGFGIEKWARGSRYCGQYKNGLRHGFGVYRFYNGDSFAGEWIGGESCGRGLQSCYDGSCFVGEFKFGVKHGFGFYCFRYDDDDDVFLIL